MKIGGDATRVFAPDRDSESLTYKAGEGDVFSFKPGALAIFFFPVRLRCTPELGVAEEREDEDVLRLADGSVLLFFEAAGRVFFDALLFFVFGFSDLVEAIYASLERKHPCRAAFGIVILCKSFFHGKIGAGFPWPDCKAMHRYTHFSTGLSFAGLILLSMGAILAQPSLSDDQCREVYYHMIKIMSEDESFPAHSAIASVEDSLRASEVETREVERCVKEMSLETYRCLANAKDVIDLMQCNSPLSTGSESQPQAGNQASSAATETSDGGFNALQVKPIAISVAACKKSYDHLVSVYSNSPILKKRVDGGELLKYWNSSEAKTSYQKRCQTVFTAADLGCILSTTDPDVIQGCLIQIPE